MLTVKLLDDTCAHEPLFYSTKNQDKIRIIKDEKVNEGDIVIYSNNFFHKTHIPHGSISVLFSKLIFLYKFLSL